MAIIPANFLSDQELEQRCDKIVKFVRENSQQYNLQRSTFFEELRKAVVTEDGLLLKIPSTDKFLGNIRKFKKELYIQEQYNELFGIVLNDYFQKSVTNFIITGNPGIGKSFFGLYVMYRLVLMNQLFMYEETVNRIVLYFPGNQITMDRRQAKFLTDKFGSEIVYLADLSQREEPDSTLLYKFGMVFASPNPLRYQNFNKLSDTQKYYMKIATASMILEMAALLSDCTRDINLINEQMDIYGPIPRFVLERGKASEGIVPLQDAIDSKGSSVFQLLSARTRQKDDDQSHILIHLNTTNYVNHFEKPASSVVVELLIEHHRSELSKAFLLFMQDPSTVLKGFAGYVFDVLGPVVYLPGKTHKILPLTSGVRKYGEVETKSNNTDSPFLIEVTKTKRLHPGWDAVGHGTEKFEENVVYWQPSRMTESIDCFSIHGRKLILYQLTVSKEHFVNGNSLELIVTVVARLTQMERVPHLVFVTVSPSSTERISDIQALKESKLNYSSIDKIPENIRFLATKQYVLHLDGLFSSDLKK
jgi:hypothetical protein